MMIRLLAFALTTFVATAAFANEPSDPPTEVVYSRRTILDFSAVEVTGETSRPDTSYVVVPKRARFRCLVRVRGDFRDRLEQSVLQLK